jgi:catechol 2,3-dioxygenase-like lactoylglutathione lyase family enzyme
VIASFNHFSLTVSNLDKSVDFYQNLIGLELISCADRPQEYSEKVTGIKGSQLKVAYLRGHGITLELIEYAGSKKRTPSTCDNIGAGHICFNVDSLSDVLEQFKKHGAKLVGEVVEVVAGANKGALAVYTSDPDGIVIELIQPPPGG